jgi:WD40 repeat protein
MSKQQLRKEWRIESEYSRIFTGGDIFLSKNEQVVYGLSDAGIKIFDIDSPNLASTISKVYFGISLLKENEEIVGFVVDHSERNLVSFSRNMLLRVWDLETKICKRSLKSHDSYIVTMDFDSSGKLIATGIFPKKAK